MHAGLGHGWPQSLGFRIGQSSEECDVVISLYSADWPFAIFKVLTGEHPSHALRSNSRSPWRPREGLRNVYNTAIRRARSPWRPCGSVTADVHGCPRGVAPLRPPLAIRDTLVAHTGGETPQSPHHSTGCAARPSLLFSP